MNVSPKLFDAYFTTTRFFVVFLTVLLLPEGHVKASPVEKDIIFCTKIPDNEARLGCFDKIALERSLVKAKSSQAPKMPKPIVEGKWQTNSSKSKFDDSTNVFLWLDAKFEVQISVYETVLPRLYLRCFENEVSLFIDFDHFLGSREALVEYRIGDEKMRSRNWSISTDHRAIGLWRNRHAIPFIKSLYGHDRFLFRMIPYSEKPVEVEFEIAKLEQSIQPLAKQCGWAAPSNEMVRDVQTMLNELGYDAGPIDGQFGSQTRDAIRNFERDRGFPVSGELDEATRKIIQNVWRVK